MSTSINNDYESTSKSQLVIDKFAIGLSLLCSFHCAALPALLLVLPNMAALNIDSEIFHIGMIITIIPTSIYAIIRGYQQHRHDSIPAVVLLGLMLLVCALLFEVESIGELGELYLTLSGSALVVFGHFRNFSLCHRHSPVSCSE